MVEKKSLKEQLKNHLVTVILTAVVLFLLQQWLGSLVSKITGLQGSIDKATESRQELSVSLNQLKWQINDIDKDVVKKLDDHEKRLRELEKK